MYLLISYDLTNTNDTKIHLLTLNINKALDAYDNLVVKLDAFQKYDRAYDCFLHHFLIELLNIPDDFDDIEGFTLYWGDAHDHVQIIRSNNRPNEISLSSSQ